jgi:hypothetical protein
MGRWNPIKRRWEGRDADWCMASDRQPMAELPANTWTAVPQSSAVPVADLVTVYVDETVVDVQTRVRDGQWEIRHDVALADLTVDYHG